MMIADSPVDHQSAHLSVTPQHNSALSQPRALPNLTIVLAVLGSIVLLLLTVLVILLCQVTNTAQSGALSLVQIHQHTVF